jgi:hypothetical protein
MTNEKTKNTTKTRSELIQIEESRFQEGLGQVAKLQAGSNGEYQKTRD